MSERVTIIFCNDSPELVLLGSFTATQLEATKNSLALKHYESCKWNYLDYEQYRKVCYWHTHEVKTKEFNNG